MTRAKRTMMALLVLLAVACMAAPALAAEKTVPSTKGWYTIRSNTNGKLALDAKNGGTDDGTNLRAYRANRTLDQLFQFKKVKSGVYEIACAANGEPNLLRMLFFIIGANSDQYMPTYFIS